MKTISSNRHRDSSCNKGMDVPRLSVVIKCPMFLTEKKLKFILNSVTDYVECLFKNERHHRITLCLYIPGIGDPVPVLRNPTPLSL